MEGYLQCGEGGDLGDLPIGALVQGKGIMELSTLGEVEYLTHFLNFLFHHFFVFFCFMLSYLQMEIYSEMMTWYGWLME